MKELEIKFRCWDFVNKQMLRWHEMCQAFEMEDFNLVSQSQYKFMQFTNTKDKNGKEVYEGDIVEFKEAGYVNSVIWDTDLAKWVLDDWHVEWYDEEDRKNFEVIGNIYETPEILKI